LRRGDKFNNRLTPFSGYKYFPAADGLLNDEGLKILVSLLKKSKKYQPSGE